MRKFNSFEAWRASEGARERATRNQRARKIAKAVARDPQATSCEALPLTEIPGLPRKVVRRLQRNGITRVGDVPKVRNLDYLDDATEPLIRIGCSREEALQVLTAAKAVRLGCDRRI